MKVYIALLRGINVGGHKIILMAELRELLTSNGLSNVKTYIQSGNVIFNTLEEEIAVLEDKIKKVIMDRFGFEVSVIVKTRAQLQRIFNNCPFSEEKKENSYFTLLHTIPAKKLIESVSNISYPNEEFVVTGPCIYFYSAMGYGKVKFNNNFFERKLKTSATARNYKTMVKLLSLSTE